MEDELSGNLRSVKAMGPADAMLDRFDSVFRQNKLPMDIKTAKSQNTKNKIKLIKDLKYGKVHLRQSLLELNQFEDMTKLFKIRKEHYAILDQDVTLATEKTEQNEDDAQILMSPFERIQLYRKEKLNKKLKQKMHKMLDKE